MENHSIGYSGSWVKWVVPKDVRTVQFVADGAGSPGAKGARVTGQLNVRGGDALWVLVGEAGSAGSGNNGGKATTGGGGRGGDGRSSNSGNSGGGATVIRKPAKKGGKDGTILVVAGGGGGRSGSGASGGAGGPAEGEDGSPGTDPHPGGYGGSQRDPGLGGKSSLGGSYKGEAADRHVLGGGGTGGGPTGANVTGGGGGGGGYYGGGGGAAGSSGTAPAGGGGGGSSYVGPGVSAPRHQRAGGDVGNGTVHFSWVPAKAKNNPPLPPTKVKVNGVASKPSMATMATERVVVTAQIDDPDKGQKIRMVLIPDPTDPKYANRWRDTNIAGVSLTEQDRSKKSKAHTEPIRVKMVITGLRINTLYRGRLYTVDERGVFSTSYAGLSFWTDRSPNTPEQVSPRENSSIPKGDAIRFEWKFTDPDGAKTQGGFQLAYRTSATPAARAGKWVVVQEKTARKYVDVAGGVFRGGLNYDWRIKVRDSSGLWSGWSLTRSLYIVASTMPPLPTYPIGGGAVQVGPDVADAFTWTFRSKTSGKAQVDADLRYRAAGAASWITLYGGAIPGADGQWPMALVDLQPNIHYEWQVRTSATGGDTSDWSPTEDFWTLAKAGSLAPAFLIGSIGPKPPLGEGNNRAFVYDRGGQVLRGELTNLTSITWARQRDDIADASVHIESFDDDLLQLLRQTHTWMHELVIFRESFGQMERVWEGPIIRIQDSGDGVEIAARDCMQYLARRVMRQGYNDSYQKIKGAQVGLRTVVERAELNVINALAYDDPNLVGYLTAVKNAGDAKQSRVVPDFAKMVQEDIDDMAANAGLDYTTVGRRIVLWDTHQQIARLPEMRAADFLTPPTVTEYGMDLANFYGVTDGSGIHGEASRGLDKNGQPLLNYGWVEMLATAYGVDEDEKSSNSDALTQQAIDKKAETYSEQAERNISPRWPAPVLVKVAENARLSPEVNLGINQLVPGAWVPVRVKSRIRDISQWQKIDNVTVTQTSEAEQVTVVMSPAPNGGQDPDAEGGETA